MSDPPAMPPQEPPNPFQPPPQYPPQSMMYPESSGAMTALVLAIIGIVACQILAPVGWYLGQKELDAIDAGRRDPTKRDLANAAKIVGMIGTALIALILLFGIGVIVLIAAGSG